MQSLSTSDRIAAIIEPWAKSPDKPDFRVHDMIIMALLDNAKGLTQAQVAEWIVDNFRFYKLGLTERLWETPLRHRLPFGVKEDLYPADKEISLFRARFKQVFSDINVPFCVRFDGENPVWSISEVAGFACLPSAISGQPEVKDVPFRFLDLAPEIRNTIYEMAFQLPVSGVGYDENTKSLKTLTRDIDEPPNFADWQTVDFYGFAAMIIPTGTSRTQKSMLETFTVNRQFRQEAMPVFYNLNHFHFADVCSMNKHLAHIPADMRTNISWISFTYARGPTGYVEATEDAGIRAFRMLRDISKLRRLDVSIDEKAWVGAGGGSVKYKSVMNWLGLIYYVKFAGWRWSISLAVRQLKLLSKPTYCGRRTLPEARSARAR